MKLVIFTFTLVGAILALAQENYDYEDDYDYEGAAERTASPQDNPNPASERKAVGE